MCREVLKQTGDHVHKEPAGATVYAGGFPAWCLTEARQLHTFMQIVLREQNVQINTLAHFHSVTQLTSAFSINQSKLILYITLHTITEGGSNTLKSTNLSVLATLSKYMQYINCCCHIANCQPACHSIINYNHI